MKNERENLAERYAIRGYCETPFVTRTSEKPEGKAAGAKRRKRG